MADTVKLPVIGPVKKQFVWIGGALVVGIVGYAYWTRSRAATPPELTPEELADSVPADRVPPPTVVGAEDFDDANVRAIINTNSEWFVAAVDYLSTTAGYDTLLVSATLGKFLARRALTANEVIIVQAAKGAVGDPPQGGPWPIITATPTTPTPPKIKTAATATWQGTQLNRSTTWREVAARYSASKSPNAIQSTLLELFRRNPTLAKKYGKRQTGRLPTGTKVLIPVWKSSAA